MTRNRILGKENEANFAEFPWMLAVLYGDSYRCGASLIHPKVALTAAHCVQASGIYKIRAGEWDWDSTREPLQHQDRFARKIILHPRYDSKSLINDIALVIVERAFRLLDHVGIVCLPHQETVLSGTSDCIATGWGKTSYSSNKDYEAVLKEATMPIVENHECVQSLQRAQFGPTFRLHESFLCAGGDNKDTCKGDGGSPLVCQIDGKADKYQQVGIVSWGLVCGRTNCPGVYVNVALFTQWIDNQMMNYNLDSQIYKY
ncbi:anionic trypsin-2-like, partial [Asbolus verrucosus]